MELAWKAKSELIINQILLVPLYKKSIQKNKSLILLIMKAKL